MVRALSCQWRGLWRKWGFEGKLWLRKLWGKVRAHALALINEDLKATRQGPP